ncbi:hypothetical protein BEH94_05280 [Candidatus Altiarchaeales archaeon WOR_SM1_SCG]|nr:hypothetical protein BEH94_05280 [Candidatus Altiarchaeales archaeon WOR_SM1_SCG]
MGNIVNNYKQDYLNIIAAFFVKFNEVRVKNHNEIQVQLIYLRFQGNKLSAAIFSGSRKFPTRMSGLPAHLEF